MEARIFVAGRTLSRKPGELTVRMAIFAADLDMRAGQWKIALIMIERNSIPILWRMTGCAVRTEAAVVFIVLTVTGIAISGRALEIVVLMAFRAVHASMFPFELEGGQVMIECSFFPAIGRVAGFTGRAKAQLVRVIRAVAGETFLRRGFEIGQAARIYVAQGALYILMSTGQPKLGDIVIKTSSKYIHTIMASQTVRV